MLYNTYDLTIYLSIYIYVYTYTLYIAVYYYKFYCAARAPLDWRGGQRNLPGSDKTGDPIDITPLCGLELEWDIYVYIHIQIIYIYYRLYIDDR